MDDQTNDECPRKQQARDEQKAGGIKEKKTRVHRVSANPVSAFGV